MGNEKSWTLLFEVSIIVIVGLLSFVIGQSYSKPTYKQDYESDNLNAVMQEFNESVYGVYFPHSSFCIDLNRDNIDELMQTLNHEFVHDLIIQNRTCGDEGCYEHFCK